MLLLDGLVHSRTTGEMRVGSWICTQCGQSSRPGKPQGHRPDQQGHRPDQQGSGELSPRRRNKSTGGLREHNGKTGQKMLLPQGGEAGWEVTSAVC